MQWNFSLFFSQYFLHFYEFHSYICSPSAVQLGFRERENLIKEKKNTKLNEKRITTKSNSFLLPNGRSLKEAEEILNRLDFSSSIVLFNGILKTENYKLIRNRERKTRQSIWHWVWWEQEREKVHLQSGVR